MSLTNNFSAFLFSLSGLLMSITSAVLALTFLIYGKSKTQRLFAFFNLAIVWWGMGAFFIGRATNSGQALFLFKIAYIGVTFISVFLSFLRRPFWFKT